MFWFLGVFFLFFWIIFVVFLLVCGCVAFFACFYRVCDTPMDASVFNGFVLLVWV